MSLITRHWRSPIILFTKGQKKGTSYALSYIKIKNEVFFYESETTQVEDNFLFNYVVEGNQVFFFSKCKTVNRFVNLFVV